MAELTAEQLAKAETLSLDELKKLALEDAAAQEADPKDKPVVKDQPRGADGKFAKLGDGDGIEIPADEVADEDEDAPVTKEEAEDEPDEYVFERAIDLGDGSGKQVFRGKGATKEEALTELTDKLAKAQENASKTIADFRKKLPKTETPAEKKFTDDDEYVFAQLQAKKPTEAFKKLFKEVVGQDISEFQSDRAAFAEWKQERVNSTIQQNFIDSHPDYVASPENGKLISEWGKTHGFPVFSEDALDKAYQDLKASGLLKLKSERADADTEASTSDKGGLPNSDAGTTQQRSSKKGSTLRSTGRTAPVVKTAPSEDEAYSMPMDKLRQLADAQLAKAARGE